MLYTFKSSSAADVIMQRFSAETMLSIIGKTPGKTGVITVSEMDTLIRKIESGFGKVLIVFWSYSELAKLLVVMWCGACEFRKQVFVN